MGTEVFVPFPHIWPGNQSIGFFSEESKDFNERGGVLPALGGYSKAGEYRDKQHQLCSAEQCETLFHF